MVIDSRYGASGGSVVSQNWFSGLDMTHEATPLELRTQSIRPGLVLSLLRCPRCRVAIDARRRCVTFDPPCSVWGHELEEPKNDRRCHCPDCASFPRVRGSVVAIPAGFPVPAAPTPARARAPHAFSPEFDFELGWIRSAALTVSTNAADSADRVRAGPPGSGLQ